MITAPLLLTLLSCPTPQSDPGGLLELHLQWLGGRGAVDGLGRSGVHASQVQDTVRLELWASDAGMLVEYRVGEHEGSFAVGSSDAWEKDPLGRTLDMESGNAADRRLQWNYLLHRHLLDAGWQRETGGAEERDGRVWERLMCEHPELGRIELLIDPEDGACGFVRMRPPIERESGPSGGGMPGWTALRDWRLLAGVRHAYESRAPTGTVTTTEALAIESLPASRFVRPGVERPVQFGAEAWQTLELGYSGHSFVRGRIGDQEAEMMLDSGAGITVIDRRLAEAAGLELGAEIGATGIGGTVAARMAPPLDLQVGDVLLLGVSAAVLDLSDIEEQMGRPLPVILGRSLFAQCVVDLDYPRARVAFRDPESFRYSGTGRSVPLRTTENGLKLVACRVEGGPPAWFQVDTGSGDTVDLFTWFSDREELMRDRSPRSIKLSGGVGGFHTTPVASLRSFEFGGYELEDLPASFPDAEKGGAFATTAHAGNLGAGIFDRFRMILDFRGDRLHLEPAEDWRERPYRRDSLGLTVLPVEGRAEVLLVSPGSPAAEAGLQKGARITAVNGVTGTGAELTVALRDLRVAAPGTRVTLSTADGEEHSLVLRRFY